MLYPLGRALLIGGLIALVLIATAPLWTRALVKAKNFFMGQLTQAGRELDQTNEKEGENDESSPKQQ